MEVRFIDSDLERLDAEPGFTAGLPPDAVGSFHGAMQHIRASDDERDLLSPRWLEVQRLDTTDAGVVSFVLNREHRLDLKLLGDVVVVRNLVTAKGGIKSYGK